MSENHCSESHPHEPEIKRQIDAEGRCIICGLLCQIEQLSQHLAGAKSALLLQTEAKIKAEHERDEARLNQGANNEL